MSQFQSISLTFGVCVCACFRWNEGRDESVERKYNRSEEGVGRSSLGPFHHHFPSCFFASTLTLIFFDVGYRVKSLNLDITSSCLYWCSWVKFCWWDWSRINSCAGAFALCANGLMILNRYLFTINRTGQLTWHGSLG